jgi:hypothetical protein
MGLAGISSGIVKDKWSERLAMPQHAYPRCATARSHCQASLLAPLLTMLESHGVLKFQANGHTNVEVRCTLGLLPWKLVDGLITLQYSTPCR